MKPAYFAIAVFLLIAAACGSALAWDQLLDMSMLPNDPSLGNSRWDQAGDNSKCTTDSGVLHVVDDGNTYAGYAMSILPPTLGPLTLESRVRVDGGDSAFMFAENASSRAIVYMSPNQLQVRVSLSKVNTYSVDMSTFRTVRIALDPTGNWFVWVDNTLLSSGIPWYSDPQASNFWFGAVYGSASSSYWDYVAYSKAFLPAPEPSSLLVLVLGILPLAGAAVRRTASA